MYIYTDIAQCNNNFRAHIFPLLKPFIKVSSFTDEERQMVYGVSSKDYVLVDDLEAADVAILPMSWNYYVRQKQQVKAQQFIELAGTYNKQVWIAMLGDFGLSIPEYPHCRVFRASGYGSKLSEMHLGMPVFINDPIRSFYNDGGIFERPYAQRPVIGFCGQANNGYELKFKELFKIGVRNLLYFVGLRKQMPEALESPTFLRGHILKLLEASEAVTTNFIIRSAYRAGASSKEERYQTSFEFYDNMRDSDYILCVRGAGNFSVRLYETLAMGRIPVYVHTDGLLPLAHVIDWKQHVVWVEENELSIIGEKVLAFHEALGPEGLTALFLKNRDLWKDCLQLGGFFNGQET